MTDNEICDGCGERMADHITIKYGDQDVQFCPDAIQTYDSK